MWIAVLFRACSTGKKVTLRRRQPSCQHRDRQCGSWELPSRARRRRSVAWAVQWAEVVEVREVVV